MMDQFTKLYTTAEQRTYTSRLTLTVILIGIITVGSNLNAQVAPKLVQNLDLSGVWQSSWGQYQATITFIQIGQNVVGTYTSTGSEPGALAGRLTGRRLVGRWTETGASGGFVFNIDAMGHSFTGSWGQTVGSVSSGGGWNGRRISSPTSPTSPTSIRDNAPPSPAPAHLTPRPTRR